MCDCIKKTEDRLFAHLKEKYPERTIVEDSEDGLQNTAFTFGDEENEQGTKLFVPFQYRYTFEKKNGTTSAVKKETVKMFYTFCPFCGQPYSKPKDSIKVSEIFTQAIAEHCREVCDIEKPVMAILKAINGLNQTAYTGVLFQDELAYGKDKETAISWHEFMNSFVPSPFKLEI